MKPLRKKNIKKEVRKRRYVYALTAILSVVALIAAGWGLRTASRRWQLFNLKRIDVTGELKTVSPEEVREWSEVRLGSNLFTLDLEDIQANLERHSIFKKIVVHRRFPNTLLLELAEFAPEFILHTERMYYVDERGEIFKDITEGEERKDFPSLTGVTEDMILSDPVRVREKIREATRLKRIYLASEFAKSFGLSEVHFDESLGYVVYPEKQRYSIKFGEGDFEAKMEKLAQFWQQLEKAPVSLSSIDLNYPGKVLMTL